jgi:H+-translocating NAD(P) transhydrogenase subunit alpha
MKISALKERAPNETRCAITPETAKLFISKGFSVMVEQGIAESAGFSDSMYTESGAKVSAVPLEIISDADIILKVQPSPLENKINEIEFAKPGAIILGLLSPYNNKVYIEKLVEKKLSGLAMELVPRITKTQNMDALSSQTNLAGYRAVIEASYYFNRAFPMMMTAAGTIIPAKVLVLGVGVAGLQAIATARRLGASVAAYDVRSTTKEQVESLGAKFLSPESSINMETSAGYAKEVSEEYKKKQEQFLSAVIKNYDIIITTAQIPGKQAPMLVTAQMIKTIKPSSVILDMATASGGNVEGSKIDEVITKGGVKIIGWSNLAARISADSSKLYAKNLSNFLDHSIQNGKFNFEDEVVKQMIVTKYGK